MRDSRPAQLRSIRLTNVNHFVNYAEAITTRANELALLGDTSFSQNERKRILLSGMVDAHGTNGFTTITSLVYALGIDDFATVPWFLLCLRLSNAPLPSTNSGMNRKMPFLSNVQML